MPKKEHLARGKEVFERINRSGTYSKDDIILAGDYLLHEMSLEELLHGKSAVAVRPGKEAGKKEKAKGKEKEKGKGKGKKA